MIGVNRVAGGGSRRGHDRSFHRAPSEGQKVDWPSARNEAVALIVSWGGTSSGCCFLCSSRHAFCGSAADPMLSACVVTPPEHHP